MNRLITATSLAILLAFTSLVDAEGSSSSGGGSPKHTDGGIRGRIQSVAPTNFSVALRHGRGYQRLFIKPIVVHYNPELAAITVDGVSVKFLDVAVTGKYVSVVGTMKNNVLEAT